MTTEQYEYLKAQYQGMADQLNKQEKTIIILNDFNVPDRAFTSFSAMKAYVKKCKPSEHKFSCTIIPLDNTSKSTSILENNQPVEVDEYV